MRILESHLDQAVSFLIYRLEWDFRVGNVISQRDINDLSKNSLTLRPFQSTINIYGFLSPVTFNIWTIVM